jgi:hypothetical protein
MPEHAIAAFEARCGCILPEGYREFLRHVGNGGVGPPSYGLLPLGEMPSDLTEEQSRPWSELERVRRPFPFTQPWVWENGHGPGMTRQCSGPSRWVSFSRFESRHGAGSATDRPCVIQRKTSWTRNAKPSFLSISA